MDICLYCDYRIDGLDTFVEEEKNKQVNCESIETTENQNGKKSSWFSLLGVSIWLRRQAIRLRSAEFIL